LSYHTVSALRLVTLSGCGLDLQSPASRRIGFVTAARPGRVALRTPFGMRRVLDMPVGELLPRIC